MILSRAKPAAEASGDKASSKPDAAKVPTADDFLSRRDFTGAAVLLEFQKNSGQASGDTDLWLAYCLFHLGEYKRAMDLYEGLLKRPNCVPDVNTYLACCYFMLGLYDKAEVSAKNGPKCSLATRLLFHVAHKKQDENALMNFHQQLKDCLEDQLTLASIHYLRGHYQEAIEVYKRVLLENRDFFALNVYVALCYYKLDFYDVALEVLAVYLAQYPDSLIAGNLKACLNYKLYNNSAAEAELKSMLDNTSPKFHYGRDVIRHNQVVFAAGAGALKVLPSLVDVLPEARLNLVIYYLKNDQIREAYDLMKDIEPTGPSEYILKGVVNAYVGQQHDSREHLKLAQQYFQIVGSSGSECDTIPGRQCMSSCFFLLRQFDDVIVYLNSIKTYFYNDDTFNFNFGQAKAAVGAYKEAEEILSLVQAEAIKNDYVYQSWLCRCYVMNRKPQKAWEIYLKMETSPDSISLLQLIANDCYRMGQFHMSAKAFDCLERLDPNPEYWEGKRGACVGLFQQVIAGQEPREQVREVVTLLRNSSQPQVESIVRVVKKWSKDNGFHVAG